MAFWLVLTGFFLYSLYGGIRHASMAPGPERYAHAQTYYTWSLVLALLLLLITTNWLWCVPLLALGLLFGRSALLRQRRLDYPEEQAKPSMETDKV